MSPVGWAHLDAKPLVDLTVARKAAENDPRIGRRPSPIVWIGDTPYDMETHSPVSSERMKGS